MPPGGLENGPIFGWGRPTAAVVDTEEIRGMPVPSDWEYGEFLGWMPCALEIKLRLFGSGVIIQPTIPPRGGVVFASGAK